MTKQNMNEQEFKRLQCQAHGHHWMAMQPRFDIADLDIDDVPKIEPIHAFCITCGRKYD